MTPPRLHRIALVALVALAFAPGPLAAAETKHATLSAKVGKTNVQVRLLLHPQVDKCSASLNKEIRTEALRLGTAHIRGRLPALIKKAGTDASKPDQFFGVAYLVGCPKDGTAWIAFPAEGKDKQVTRYAPGLGWSGMMRL